MYIKEKYKKDTSFGPEYKKKKNYNSELIKAGVTIYLLGCNFFLFSFYPFSLFLSFSLSLLSSLFYYLLLILHYLNPRRRRRRRKEK